MNANLKTNNQKKNRSRKVINRTDWTNQYARIQRWYKRIKDIEKMHEKSNLIDENDLDIFYAFIMNCYHLMDWLKSSKTLDDLTATNFFCKENKVMMMCHDICNGEKHLQLNNIKVDDDYRFMYSYRPSPDKPVKTPLFTMGDGIYSIFSFSDQCIKNIDDFLKENNLLKK